MKETSASKVYGIAHVGGRAYMRELRQDERCPHCWGIGKVHVAREIEEVPRTVQLDPEEFAQLMEETVERPCPECGGWGWTGRTGVVR